MPTVPKQPSPLYEPPDPDTLTPAQREELKAQPWFQQVVRMQQAGVTITQEFAQKLATQQGAQGLHTQDVDLGGGRKAKVMIDRATEKTLSDSELNVPFTPSIEVMDDPVNQTKVAVLRETPTSVRKLGKDGKTSGGIELQPMTVGGKVVGLVYHDEDGKPRPFEIPKDPISGEYLPEYKALMQGMGGGTNGAPAAKPAAAAAPAVQAPAPKPVEGPKAPAGAAGAAGVQTVTTAEQRAALPAGTVYRGADGRLYRKKSGPDGR